MCTLAKRILSIGIGFFSLFTVSVSAQQISAGGIIRFRGEIVEPPCEVSTHQQQIEMSCIRDGKMHNSRFNAQQVTTVSQRFKQIAAVKMHYLNEQKNLAILHIEYK
ncbi:type 1 fimbrial protein [Citrobacter sp. Res13-Sevr-PEB04-36]|uniref:type 1 fimbrial protein n=1 Tax=Citrobacter sp. Res13-Sevr-PEB04-36 TaxID=2777960 RepID=UPI0018AD049B|nr:type 1 fimbrial protein [Citrobacter sp. Res13-Sevr-PEB04-36]